MLTNATILRIDRPSGHTADGRPLIVQGQAMAVRCCVDAISTRQRFALGTTLGDADHAVYIERPALQGVADPVPGDRMRLQPDHAATPYMAQVVTQGDRLGPAAAGLSHLELFVRKEPLV